MAKKFPDNQEINLKRRGGYGEMVKKIFLSILIVSIALTLASCKKKEEQPVPQTQMRPSTGVIMPHGETKIIVPEVVKGKWDGVTLIIEDKIAKKTSEVTVKLNSEYTIPGSNLRLKVGEFLPDFRMEGSTISSSSNEPNNPAVRVIVYENNREIFKGWLYSKFPAIHPFEHDRYGIILKKGIKKV